MAKRIGMVIAMCAVLAACGGNSGSGSNAAAGKTFSYGAATTNDAAVTSVTSTMSSALSTTASASSLPSLAGSVSVVNSTLLGSPYSTSQALSEQRSQALAAKVVTRSAEFTDEACHTETDTKITFNNCVYTDGTYSATVSGTAELLSDSHAQWDLTIHETSTDTSVSFDFTYAFSGDLQGSDTALKGQLLESLDLSASGNGQSVALGLDESLDIDVTLDSACDSRVVGGTLVGKRVWTKKPDGFNATDKAARITWTACGEATIQLSN